MEIRSSLREVFNFVLATLRVILQKFLPLSLAENRGLESKKNQEKFLGFEGKHKGNSWVQFRVQTEEEISSQNSCGEFRFSKVKPWGFGSKFSILKPCFM